MEVAALHALNISIDLLCVFGRMKADAGFINTAIMGCYKSYKSTGKFRHTLLSSREVFSYCKLL